MDVFAFVGRKRSGKDTYAIKLRDGSLKDKKVLWIAFADHMKKVVNDLFLVDDIDVFYNQDRKEVDKVYKDYTARDLMCMFGSAIRSKFGENFFVDIVHDKIKIAEKEGYDAVIITDVRFMSELKMLVGLENPTMFYAIDREKFLGPLPDDADISERSVVECINHLKDNDIRHFDVDNNIPYESIEVVHGNIL